MQTNSLFILQFWEIPLALKYFERDSIFCRTGNNPSRAEGKTIDALHFWIVFKAPPHTVQMTSNDLANYYIIVTSRADYKQTHLRQAEFTYWLMLKCAAPLFMSKTTPCAKTIQTWLIQILHPFCTYMALQLLGLWSSLYCTLLLLVQNAFVTCYSK